MKRIYPDLPDWAFNIEEISAGVYEATATDKFGHSVRMKGTDYDQLVSECRKAAGDMAARLKAGIS